jgi:O-antigen ligase
MWRDTLRMAADFPIFGVGIRAYTVASLLYQRGLEDEHVGAAHNDWLQLVAEGGVLVSIPMLILLALLTREALRRFREHRQAGDFGTTYWLRAGAATGLLAIGLQSLVEFSLQMPGNTVLFAVLWALVIAPAPRRQASV